MAFLCRHYFIISPFKFFFFYLKMPFQSVSNFSIDLLLSAHSATLPTTTISSISLSPPFDFVAVHPPSAFSPLNLAKNGNFLFPMAFAPFQFWLRPSISASDLPSTPSSSSSSTRKSAATVPPPLPSPLPSFSSVVAPSSVHSSAVLKFGHEKLLPKHQDKASNRKRRQRTIFSEEQLHLLEKAFRLTPYPEVNVRERLAERCELRTERVEVWFKNRRAKARKRAKESFKNA